MSLTNEPKGRQRSHAVQFSKNTTVNVALLPLPEFFQQNSSFGDLTKLKKRHQRPLKTTLNSRVLQNPTSARQAMNAERGGQAEKKEDGRCTMVIIPPTDEAAARQWSKTTAATGLLCPPETPATFPQTNFSQYLQSTTYN